MKAELFGRQATGGVVARTGFEYQDAFVLEHLPLWLSQGGFSHVVSEMLGDVEVRYFRSTGGTQCVLYEAKNHQLSKSNFQKEVERFLELYNKASDEYVMFELVCKDYNGEIQPVLNKLSRLRGVGQSLNYDSQLRKEAEGEIIKTLVGLGMPEATARFVLERVSFTSYSAERAKQAFAGTVEENLPTLVDLRSGQINHLRNAFEHLVAKSVKGVVYRADLESTIVQALGMSDAAIWSDTPTVVHLVEDELGSRMETLSLVSGRFNGPGRGTVGQASWNALQVNARAIGDFIKATRPRSAVKLNGKQRMSYACTLGYGFSATRGFILEVEHNGQVFRTDNHGRSAEQFFDMSAIADAQGLQEGVVAIGFPSAIAADIEGSCTALGLAGMPRLLLQSQNVIGDVDALNKAVTEAKSALSEFKSKYQLMRIHLFIKAPSVFAMVLGHRLNALGLIQLYDWIDTVYIPTASLESAS